MIPINADNGAELKTWKIVVNGTYVEVPPNAPRPANGGGGGDAGAGRLVVSSQLAKLTVAPPFLALTFDAASVEQGKEVDLAVKVDKAVDFPGEAQVTLVGLPNKVTTERRRSPRTRPSSSSTSRPTRTRRPADQEPVLPGRDHPGRRADRAQPRHRPAPDRRALCRQAERPRRAPPTAASAEAAPKPLSRLEKLRLEEPGTGEGQGRGGRPGPALREVSETCSRLQEV